MKSNIRDITSPKITIYKNYITQINEMCNAYNTKNDDLQSLSLLNKMLNFFLSRNLRNISNYSTPKDKGRDTGTQIVGT